MDGTDRREINSRQAARRVSAANQSFMGTLKTEMLQDGCFINEAGARTELFTYIETYYNTHRRHSSLGYPSPAEFEAQHFSLN
ncbi:MAG: integrase catalytic protein [Verrucomicrobiales bacterium]|nr:integrase catalytic protein [Verrucomicrobiales bacterium]